MRVSWLKNVVILMKPFPAHSLQAFVLYLGKCTSLINFTMDSDRTSMVCDGLFDDCQPQTCRRFSNAVSVFSAVEAIEYALLLVWWNANSFIAHTNDNLRKFIDQFKQNGTTIG